MVQRWSVCSKVDYRPQTKLQKGNVSTRVCHSVHWGRGMISLPVWSHVPSRREGVVPEGQVWCQRGGGLVPEGCLQWRIQDFPEEGAPTLQGGRQHTILPHFPKNCMKLKEFGPPGGRASKILLCRSATGLVWVASHPPTNQKSGRYASYWNAFLFFSENCFDHGYDRITMKNKLINTIDLWLIY